MCKLGQFIRDHVFDNNEAYNHIFQVENVFKSRDIDKKSPIFSPSCLLCNGEVIIKGSNCVHYTYLKRGVSASCQLEKSFVRVH